MPPRLPARAITALPSSNGAIASSSSLPLPPKTSSKSQSRGLHTARSTGVTPNGQALSFGQKRSFHSSSTRGAKQKDPYEVLGVKKDASASEIKKSYYQLAKKWHPDSNKEKGAQERFVEIQSAYDILSDDKKRQAYDQYGSASTEEGFDPNFAGAGGFGGFQGFGGFPGQGGGAASDLFESIFGSAFGGGGGATFGGARNRPMRGNDIEAVVNLSFLEACSGALRKLTISPVVSCKPCSGSGLKSGQKKSQCSTCRGTGQQTFQVSGMIMASPCSACGGSGSVIPRNARCGECDGLGSVKEKTTVEVDIPAGVEDGMRVKLTGKGDMPIGGSGMPGDLFVRVSVKPSSVFRRQGTNVYYDAKVPLHTALLGGKVRIPTLEGDVEVRVREGTQTGEEAVLKGRGVKSVVGFSRDRGDLIVGWKVQIPRSLSPFQKKLMQAFADDIEGKQPQVHFGPLPTTPSSTGTASSPNPTTNYSSSSSPSSTSQSPPSPPSPSPSHTPPSEAQRPAHDPYKSSSPEKEEDQGVAGKVASAIGGVLGFVDKLFGGGRK